MSYSYPDEKYAWIKKGVLAIHKCFPGWIPDKEILGYDLHFPILVTIDKLPSEGNLVRVRLPDGGVVGAYWGELFPATPENLVWAMLEGCKGITKELIDDSRKKHVRI